MKNQEVVKNQEIAEIRKHSALIQINSKSLSVPQRKIFNSLLYLSAKQLQFDSSKTKFKIRFSEIMRFAGYENTENRKYFKNALQLLTETSVQTNILGKDSINTWSTFSLLSQADIKDYEEYLVVAFPPIILENIIFPSIYAILNLGIVNSLELKYSLPTYELLVDYSKVKKFKIEISKFREIIGIEPEKYKKFSWFKKAVLNPTIDEINLKSDLMVEYVLEKDDVDYSHIEFFIKHKYENLSKLEAASYQLLKSRNIPDASARKFAKQLKSQSIIEAIDILEKAIKKGSVKNSVAYLTRVLKNVEIEEEEDVIIFAHPEQSVPTQKSDYRPMVDDPKNNIEYKKYISDRVSNIISDLSMSTFNNFISELNSFTIDHFMQNNILDDSKKIVNLVALSENLVFRGWIEQKFIDENIEYNLYLETK